MARIGISSIFIGTAGWSVPRSASPCFPAEGTHLQRYAQRLNCVEINSSFYRSLASATYRRGAESTPPRFKFAVKVSRVITHDARLRGARDLIAKFLEEVRGLGGKLGPLLIQLPPSLEFETRVASRFFGLLRQFHDGMVVCGPRPATWFGQRAEDALLKYQISRVAADPPLDSADGRPGGDMTKLVYYRLHGLPHIYRSEYSSDRLLSWMGEIDKCSGKIARIVFDNTVAGHAASNALQFRNLLLSKRE